MLKTFVR